MHPKDIKLGVYYGSNKGNPYPNPHHRAVTKIYYDSNRTPRVNYRRVNRLPNKTDLDCSIKTFSKWADYFIK